MELVRLINKRPQEGADGHRHMTLTLDWAKVVSACTTGKYGSLKVL